MTAVSTGTLKHSFDLRQTVSRCTRCRCVRWGRPTGPVYGPTIDGPWSAAAPAECSLVLDANDLNAPSDWANEDLVLLDTETTGLEPTTARVIEVAAVRCRFPADGQGDLVVQDVFSTLVHPECPITDEIKRLTGIGSSMVANQPKFGEIARELSPIFAGARAVVAYNANFDRDFLLAEFLRAGVTPPAQILLRSGAGQGLLLDPMVWGKWRSNGYGKGQNKLDAMARRLGVPLPENLHRADVDAMLAGRVLLTLLRFVPRKLADALDLQAVLRCEQDADFYRYRLRKRAEERAASEAASTHSTSNLQGDRP